MHAELENVSHLIYLEGDTTNQHILSELLEPLEVATPNNIHIYETPEQARDYLLKTPNMPKAIIMNIGTTGIQEQGFDFLRYLKGKDSAFHSIPVIALSTDTHPETEEMCRSLGADYYITTPGLFEHVQETVRYIFFGEKS